MSHSSFPISPLGDRLFIKRVEARSVSKGGIHLIEDAREKPLFGRVVAFGPLVKDTNLQHENVLVLFGKYAGLDVNVLGDIYLSVREEEIQGVVTDHETAEKLVEEGV